MELFIPSATVILLCILLFMYVMPRFSPYILGLASIVLFGLGIWQHYATFPYEYNKYWSTVYDNSSFILMILLIITLMVAFRSRSSPSSGANMPQSSIPAAIAAVPVAIAAIPEMLTGSPAKNNSGRNNAGRNNAGRNTVAATNNAGRNNARNNSLFSNSFKTV